ncbi:hypothetical protein BDFG_09250, partial [Blastomyces dermatitidis ATCC 26199]
MRKLKNNVMLYCDLEYAEALYLEYSFKCNLITHIHKEFSHLEHSELISILKLRVMTEHIQIYTHRCLNYHIMKESKKELEFMKVVSEIIEKIIMKFLHNKIYMNYEILHEIRTNNNMNLIEEA